MQSSRAHLVELGLEPSPHLRVGAREFEVIEHRAHIQPRAAHEHRDDAPPAELVDQLAGACLKVRDAYGLGDVVHVEQVVSHALTFGDAQLRRADVHAAVYLHRVGIDDLAAERQGDREGEIALARGGRTDDGDHGRPGCAVLLAHGPVHAAHPPSSALASGRTLVSNAAPRLDRVRTDTGGIVGLLDRLKSLFGSSADKAAEAATKAASAATAAAGQATVHASGLTEQAKGVASVAVGAAAGAASSAKDAVSGLADQHGDKVTGAATAAHDYVHEKTGGKLDPVTGTAAGLTTKAVDSLRSPNRNQRPETD